MILSNHAKKRLVERKVKIEEIRATIEFPNYTITKNNKKEAHKKIRGRVLRVVYLEEDKYKGYNPNMEMRIEYDKETDAAYVYFKDIQEGEVTQTISLNESVNIDLDSEGKTLGIKILDASKNLPVNTLNSAIMIN